ncbi:hypothetical protein WJX73_007144 [Symbiochloris irregularis]|uniref:Uncharacterized protein n=1 Tax=Symbiochloris irregularis TaxID=706552 RepID=A0AAW1PIL3_9CHLO
MSKPEANSDGTIDFLSFSKEELQTWLLDLDFFGIFNDNTPSGSSTHLQSRLDHLVATLHGLSLTPLTSLDFSIVPKSSMAFMAHSIHEADYEAVLLKDPGPTVGILLFIKALRQAYDGRYCLEIHYVCFPWSRCPPEALKGLREPETGRRVATTAKTHMRSLQERWVLQ